MLFSFVTSPSSTIYARFRLRILLNGTATDAVDVAMYAMYAMYVVVCVQKLQI